MIVTVGSLGYQLRPYSRGGGWQLYMFATGRVSRTGDSLPDEWLPLECYPATLDRGLEIIVERTLRAKAAQGGVRQAVAEVEAAVSAIRRALAAASD